MEHFDFMREVVMDRLRFAGISGVSFPRRFLFRIENVIVTPASYVSSTLQSIIEFAIRMCESINMLTDEMENLREHVENASSAF